MVFTLREQIETLAREVVTALSARLEAAQADWQRDRLQPLLMQRLEAMNRDLDMPLAQFLEKIKDIRTNLSGLEATAEVDDARKGGLERVLAAAGGLVIAGPGAALAGATLGYQGMLRALVPNLVLMIGMIVLGFTNPLTIIAALFAAGALQVLFRGGAMAEQARQRVAENMARQLLDRAPELAEETAHSLAWTGRRSWPRRRRTPWPRSWPSWWRRFARGWTARSTPSARSTRACSRPGRPARPRSNSAAASWSIWSGSCRRSSGSSATWSSRWRTPAASDRGRRRSVILGVLRQQLPCDPLTALGQPARVVMRQAGWAGQVAGKAPVAVALEQGWPSRLWWAACADAAPRVSHPNEGVVDLLVARAAVPRLFGFAGFQRLPGASNCLGAHAEPE
jgi:hypothetical protein